VARVFLLIADIGGYTRFMTVHRINLAHAQYVVAQLLEAVIDAAAPVFKLSKLEGDAALFYGKLDEGVDVGPRVAAIRSAFLRRREDLALGRLCSCDGCVKVGELKLKFVAHEGEVAFQKVKRLTELAGVDVILVHRLLKNDVPVPEYVLASEPAYTRLSPEVRAHGTAIEHDLEGLGLTPGHYVDLATLPITLPPPPPHGFFRKLLAWMKMTWRSIPYFVGLREPCKDFRNTEALRALPPRQP
jgi:hypothetical protein